MSRYIYSGAFGLAIALMASGISNNELWLTVIGGAILGFTVSSLIDKIENR